MLRKRLAVVIQYLVITFVVGGLGAAVYLSLQKESVSALAPVYNSPNNVVCLMFNVYQNTTEVKQLVDILSSYGVSATFFLGGSWVAKNAECTNYLYDSGNEIGSHGYSHYNHSEFGYDKNKAEIIKSINKIESICPAKIKLFAPPSGAYNNSTLSACRDLGLEMILWSKDTIDWRDQNKDTIISRAITGLCAGDYILMHPTPCTVLALPTIIEGILSKGYAITTVGSSL